MNISVNLLEDFFPLSTEIEKHDMCSRKMLSFLPHSYQLLIFKTKYMMACTLM